MCLYYHHSQTCIKFAVYYVRICGEYFLAPLSLHTEDCSRVQVVYGLQYQQQSFTLSLFTHYVQQHSCFQSQV